MAEWEEVTDPAEIRKVLGAKTFDAQRKGSKGISPAAQKFLLELSGQAAAAGETERTYNRAMKDVKTLKPGPYRGAFMDVAIPTEGGGILDKLGAAVVGAPARLIGALTQEEVDAYQRLKGLQSEQVLDKQILQKGPQTESDAARLMLTEISPSKSEAVNKSVIDAGKFKSQRAQAKAVFMTKWANKYGINGVSENGNTADQVWARQGDMLTRKWLGGGTTTIKVISKKKVQ